MMQIGYIYNHYMWEVSLPYKTVLLHGLLTGFVDWYMYVYMYGWDIWRHCVTIWLYVFGEKWLCRDTLNFYLSVWLYVFGDKWLFHDAHTCIHFVSSSSWKWYAIFIYSIYGIDENDVSRENLYYFIFHFNRNNCVV